MAHLNSRRVCFSVDSAAILLTRPGSICKIDDGDKELGSPAIRTSTASTTTLSMKVWMANYASKAD